MALWTMTDNANGAPIFANTMLNITQNKNELYGNTTLSAAKANVALGIFGVSTAEMAYANTADTESDIIPHAGWTLRTQGEGGRAGRVHYEVLVAASSMGDDADTRIDDGVLPEAN